MDCGVREESTYFLTLLYPLTNFLAIDSGSSSELRLLL